MDQFTLVVFLSPAPIREVNLHKFIDGAGPEAKQKEKAEDQAKKDTEKEDNP
jgi:hypothetical protein